MKDLNEQGKVQVLRYQRSDFVQAEWEWLYDSYITQFAGLTYTDHIPLIMVQATSNGDTLTQNSMTGLIIYITPGLKQQELENTIDLIAGTDWSDYDKQAFADRLVSKQMDRRAERDFAMCAVRYNWRTHLIAPGVKLPSTAR